MIQSMKTKEQKAINKSTKALYKSLYKIPFNK